MRDGAKIAAGLAAFVALALAPVWHRALGGPTARPEPKIEKPQTRCVAPREVMRASHMQLLDGWREAVVRDARRVDHVAGRPDVTRSLTGTCLECHPNRKDFCDRCHADLAVKPVCWECHPDPKERT